MMLGEAVAFAFQDLDVTVSIPGGEEVAAKTWNARLGIEGGLSILGTTGVVRPFSAAAWIASIHRGVDVARAAGLSHVVGSTGATSEATAQARFNLPDHAMLDMGDFAGGLLKYLARHPIARLTIAGGPAKLTKLGQGAMDLHSDRSEVDFAGLSDWAGPEEHGLVKKANTVLEALAAAPGLASEIADAARRAASERAPEIAIDVMVVGRDGAILAVAE